MKRGGLVILAVVIAASTALSWVASNGVAENLVYYVTPSDVLTKGERAVGERARLGGYVRPGSVRSTGTLVGFVVTDGTSDLAVITSGTIPELFREGQGVVVEGAYATDGTFHADTVLVKHDNVYRPPAPGEIPRSAKLGR